MKGEARAKLLQLTHKAELLLKEPKNTEELNQYDTNIDSIIHDVPAFVESLGDTPNQETTGDLPQQRTKSIEADNIVSDVFTDRMRSYKEPKPTTADPSNFIDWLKDDRLMAPKSSSDIPDVKFALGDKKIDSMDDEMAAAPQPQAHGNMYPDIGLYGQIPEGGLASGSQQKADAPAPVASGAPATQAPAAAPQQVHLRQPNTRPQLPKGGFKAHARSPLEKFRHVTFFL